MAHLHDCSHQKSTDNYIKNNDLPFEFVTVVINGKRHVSHHEISRIFDLNPSVVSGMLDEFQWEEGQGDTVFFANRTFYADKHSFYALASSLALEEALMQAVLLALGHFREMAP